MSHKLSTPLLNELRSLALAAAPELRTAELRLLNHNPAWPLREHVVAYSVQGPHIGIRDRLIAMGQWQNVWPAAIVFAEHPHSTYHLAGVLCP